jgi:hypothetical protein
MSLPFKDPLKLLESALKATNPKDFDNLYDESVIMFNHKDYKAYAINNRNSNNTTNNISYQYNVAGGPNNGAAVLSGWGTQHHHSSGSAVAPISGLRTHLG